MDHYRLDRVPEALGLQVALQEAPRAAPPEVLWLPVGLHAMLEDTAGGATPIAVVGGEAPAVLDLEAVGRGALDPSHGPG